MYIFLAKRHGMKEKGRMQNEKNRERIKQRLQG
jgi:hypothetical protein